MNWHEIYLLANEAWVLWAILIYFGIVVWAYLPAQRDRLQKHADIPLRND
jgi:cbb3-type cytochrome oxidase subunit 3